MVNKLRKKFILITMLSLFAVLFTIIAGMNIANYLTAVKTADTTLDFVVGNRDVFQNPNGNKRPVEDFNPEIPFTTRFFSITYNSNGNVVSASLNKIASVDDTKAISMSNDVYNGKKTKGYYDYFRYRVVENENGTEIVFLDCQRDIEACNTFLLISSLISVSGYLVVFLLIFFISKKVVKPFYQNQVKQKQFITDASHELKTPLTVINANVEIIEMDNGESEWTESIKKQVQRLTVMTKKMTMLASMDEDESIKMISDVNLSNLLTEEISDFEAVISVKNARIIYDIEPNIVIKGSEDLLKELFSIYLENANKYSTGDININLSRIKDTVEVTFKNPAEVPDGNLDYLFDRFYRLDSSRNSENGGSGIGLSLARAIALKHNAATTAYGENKIITFKILFKI